MRRSIRVLQITVLVSDLLVIGVSALIAAVARWGLPDLGSSIIPPPIYLATVTGIAVITIVAAWGHGLYRPDVLLGRVHRLLFSVMAPSYGFIATMTVSFMTGRRPIVRQQWLLFAWLGAVLLFPLVRFGAAAIMVRLRRRGMFVTRRLVAGANDHGVAVASVFHRPTEGEEVVGFLDDFLSPGAVPLDGVPVVGHPKNAFSIAQTLNVSEIVIVGGALSWESQRGLAELSVWAADTISTQFAPTFHDLLASSAVISKVGPFPIIALPAVRLRGIQAVWKGAMDRSVAAVLLVFLSPWGIKLAISARRRQIPMFIGEAVRGLGNSQFDLLCISPSLVPSPVMGRLASLVNVLRGNLSLVGPRPIRIQETVGHQKSLVGLTSMRPGLTGYWRVEGTSKSVEDRIELDLYYVRAYSPVQDVVILFRTLTGLVRHGFGNQQSLDRWRAIESEELDGSGPHRDDLPVRATS
jgi:lipopolysaccharide/colanic/teichoic acid biosynthesis glycosyltransferase